MGLRTTRLLTDFTLAAVLVLGRVGSLSRLVVLLLRSSSSAGMGFWRRVFGLLRVTRPIVRAAGFTAFPERGFFVFIPGCYPFGGYRILSDASYITAAARQAQRETGAEKVGNLVCEPGTPPSKRSTGNRRHANLTLQLLDRQLRARKGREGKQAGPTA